MPQYFSAKAYPEDKRLRDFLDTAGFRLHASKKKQILEVETRKTSIEIQYIEDKVATGRAQLQKTTKAIRETEIRLREAEMELPSIRKEREAAESEHEKLKTIEKEIESKRAVLPDMKRQIAYVRGDVSKLSAGFKALQSTHRKSLVKKEDVEKEMVGLKTRLSGLENEIPVMRNTIDILVGLMPEGFDADTFDEIQDQGEIEKVINDYIAEVNEHKERLEKERSDLNTQIDKKHAQERSLLSQKEALEGKIEDLTAVVGGEVEKATIVDEVNRLRDDRERFAAESGQMMKEVNQSDSEIKILDDELEQGKGLERELSERYSCLTSRKQEMDEFDDIDAEIERLRNEIQKHDRDSNVNVRLTEITNDIKQYVGLMNGKLRSAIEEHDKPFRDFCKLAKLQDI